MTTAKERLMKDRKDHEKRNVIEGVRVHVGHWSDGLISTDEAYNKILDDVLKALVKDGVVIKK